MMLGGFSGLLAGRWHHRLPAALFDFLLLLSITTYNFLAWLSICAGFASVAWAERASSGDENDLRWVDAGPVVSVTAYLPALA
jgi:hypothetical protein